MVYYIAKTIEVAACHRVSSQRGSKCENLHGHNWTMTIHCKAENLNEDGMVLDFNYIKQVINEKFDHKNLNEVFDFSPTSENLARWLVENVPLCYRATVKENDSSEAIYEV